MPTDPALPPLQDADADRDLVPFDSSYLLDEMTNSDSIPVAVRAGEDAYFITFQLMEPEMTSWHAQVRERRFHLEVSTPQSDNWFPLGTYSAGEIFEVPAKFKPIPLFRIEEGERWRYIGVRKIDLQGTSNFRDVGGYDAEGSTQLQFGKIFRSDNLAALTRSDWNTLEALEVSHIIDLRRSDEKARSRTVLPKHSDIEVVEIPIDVEILGKSELLEHIFSREITRITDDDMAQMYESILATARDELRRTVSLLLDPDHGSKIVHCTAGKDRTGLSVALVQLLFNVQKREIMSDFLLSNSFRTPARVAALSEKLASHQIALEDIVPYLSASRPALSRAFEILDLQYGGVKNYLDMSETARPPGSSLWKKHLLYQ